MCFDLQESSVFELELQQEDSEFFKCNFLILRQNKLDYKNLVRLAVVDIDLTYNGHIFHLEYKGFVMKQI